MITRAALKNGFTGGLIVDYPNSKKAKKYYLFLMAGYSDEIMNEAKSVIMPKAKMEESDDEMDESDDEMDEEEKKSEEWEDESEEEVEEKINVKGRTKKTKMI
mmetsp:Transcript_28420/g.21232  ORF Transcript_28420/g.21232 Transcript_28420/m.21232 type:complete len:103 (+) Transcript_28420:510-818(+)|eukprot:CAMPEP_0202957960 /NCGR_PEP_ID=MMETSP1396-20130829/2316_1 /ASSEMBLY_ACC=CAM_ASM_000872 /TAXON_ID= /ORGANISM="Pseudokeronopsis sp., Strain Brazil" /LENGTH=102 /DNA_ID=CAMNT_0049675717 /DNA_START=501 /DNA_END=809 /DNA_ORIENTATION=-